MRKSSRPHGAAALGFVSYYLLAALIGLFICGNADARDVYTVDPTIYPDNTMIGPDTLLVGGEGIFDITFTNPYPDEDRNLTFWVMLKGEDGIEYQVWPDSTINNPGRGSNAYAEVTIPGLKAGKFTLIVDGYCDYAHLDHYHQEKPLVIMPRDPDPYFDRVPLGSKLRRVDIHGVPMADPSPTGDGESDRIPNQACIDMYNLDLMWAVSDLSVPLEGGELSLEMRRTMRIRSRYYPYDPKDLNPVYGSDNVLGLGWESNLTARAVMKVDKATAPDGTEISYVVMVVTDEVGNQFRYQVQGTLDAPVFVPETTFGFNNESLKSSLTVGKSPVDNATCLVLKREHGTQLYFQFVMIAYPPYLGSTQSFEYYFRLNVIQDRFGNQLRYTYKFQGTPSSMADEVLATLPAQILFVDAKMPNNNQRWLRFVYNFEAPFGSSMVADPGLDMGARLCRVYGSDGRDVLYGFAASTNLLTQVKQPMLVNGVTGASARPTVNLTYTTWNVQDVTLDPTKPPATPRGLNVWVAPNVVTDPRGHATTFGYHLNWYPTTAYVNFGGSLWKIRPEVASVTTMDGTAIFTGTDLLTAAFPSFITNTVVDTVGTANQYGFTQSLVPAPNLAGCVTTVSNFTRTTLGNGITSNNRVSYQWADKETIDVPAIGTIPAHQETVGDPNGNLISVTDMSNNVITYSYNSNDAADPYNKGVNTAFPYYHPYLNPRYYQAFGKPSTRTMGSASAPLTTTYRYEVKYNKETRVTNAEGITTTEVIDPATGNRTSVTEASGTSVAATTSYEYDTAGFVTKKTDPDNRITTYARTYPNSSPTRYQLVTETQTGYGGSEMSLVTQTYSDVWNNPREVIDARNYTTLMTYDAMNRLTSTTKPLVTVRGGSQSLGTSKTTYDLNGNPLMQTDAEGNVTLRTYDLMNRVTEERTRMVSPTANTVGSDLVTKTNYKNANGKSVGLVMSTTDARGKVTSYQYDGLLRLTKKTFPGVTETTGGAVKNYSESYVYGANAGSGAFTIWSGWQPTLVTDRLGAQTSTDYDGLYRPTLIKRNLKAGDTTTSGALITAKTYNKMHKVTSETTTAFNTTDVSAVTRVTLTYYDSLMRPVAVAQDLNGGTAVGTIIDNALTYTFPSTYLVTRTGYNKAGLATATMDAEGKQTDTTYDGAGRPIAVQQPLVTVFSSSGVTSSVRPTTVMYYDAAGNKERITDANGTTTRIFYDAYNRVIKTVVLLDGSNGVGSVNDAFNGPNQVTTTVYNLVDKPVQVTDSRGNTTDTYYDRAYRVDYIDQPTVTDAEHANALVRPRTRTTYDLNGNVLTLTDARGVVTTNTYDEWNRLRTSTAASSNATVSVVTEKQYDANNNVTALILKNTTGDQKTIYTYDSFNRKTTETLPSPDAVVRKTTWTYYSDGAVRTILDPKGQTVTNGYDGAGRLTSVQLGAAESRSLILNKVGKPTKITDIAGVTDLTYDNLYRVQTETRTDTGQPATTVTSSYDAVGNRTKVVYPTTNRTLISTYDRANRLTQVQDSNATGTKLSVYTYDANGNRATCTTPNGVQSTYSYDALNRNLTSATLKGTATVTKFTYAYDLVGNRRSMQEALAAQGSRVVTYAYDDLYQLTGEAWPSNTVTYLYDKAGNRTQKTVVQGLVTTTTTVTYDVLNRATGLSVNGVATTTYTYDLNGNLLTKAVAGQPATTYVWDVANRLVGADTTGDLVNDFVAVYDYRTRRVSKTEGGVATRFLYDQGDCYQELKAGAVQVEFVRGSGLGGGIGSILYSDRRKVVGGKEETFAYNPSVGHVVALTSDVGAVLETNRYDAFGGMVKTTGTSLNNRLANTKERDASLGLDNHGFRYYDPALGRYVSRDPIGYKDGLNVYCYVRNNPINRIDPLGLIVKYEGDEQVKELRKKDDKIKEMKKTQEYDRSRFGKMSEGDKKLLDADKRMARSEAAIQAAGGERAAYFNKNKGLIEMNEKLKGAVESIRSADPRLAGMVRDLEMSNNTITIKSGSLPGSPGHTVNLPEGSAHGYSKDSGGDGMGAGSNITLDPEWKKDSFASTLSHEMQHAWDFNGGIADDRRVKGIGDRSDPDNIEIMENRAMHTQNLFLNRTGGKIYDNYSGAWNVLAPLDATPLPSPGKR